MNRKAKQNKPQDNMKFCHISLIYLDAFDSKRRYDSVRKE